MSFRSKHQPSLENLITLFHGLMSTIQLETFTKHKLLCSQQIAGLTSPYVALWDLIFDEPYSAQNAQFKTLTAQPAREEMSFYESISSFYFTI